MKKLKIISVVIIIIYLILLIPELGQNEIEVAQQTQFVWDSDSLWNFLEKSFTDADKSGCDSLSVKIGSMLNEFSKVLDSAEKQNLKPDDKIFESLLNTIFYTAPLIAACPDSSSRYIELISIMRQLVKDKSRNWNPEEQVTRNILYKLLYGSRAAVEEIILQSDENTTPSLTYGLEEPSVTPFTTFLGVKMHSGDILISRGGAPTSALISRGNDYPGNFSHVAFLYVDPETNIPSIIEAHIEIGVVASSLDDYIKDKKLRVMVLRLRSDLPKLIADPMIPHKAAKTLLDRTLKEHIPYDFEMDYKNNNKLFCSEVASSAYKDLGINIWMSNSTISSVSTAQLLAGFGVKNFETQEPSDLEYDPQISVVAEWRDIKTLYNDHIDNAVVDAILEWTEEGKDIEIDWYMLPIVRTVKLYSVILNMFDKVGPVPEGMSATSALRHEAFKDFHTQIKSHVLSKAENFISVNGFTPPYWRLLEFARDYLQD